MPINKKNTSLDNSVTVTNNHGIHTRLDTINQSLQDLEVNIGGDLNFNDDNITSNIHITNELITGLNSNVVVSNIALLDRLDQQLSVNTISGYNLETTQVDVLSNIVGVKSALEGTLDVNTISGYNLETTQVDVLSNIVGVKSALEGTLDVNTISGFNLETTQQDVLSNVTAMKTALEGTLDVNTISGFNLETTQQDVLSNVTAMKTALEGTLDVNTISGYNLETTQEQVLSNIVGVKSALEGTLDVNTISGFNLETTQEQVLSNVSAMKTALEGTLDVNTISGFNLETTQQDVLSNVTAMKTALEGTLDVNTISGFNLETTQQDVLSNVTAMKTALEGTLDVNTISGFNLESTQLDILSNIQSSNVALVNAINGISTGGGSLDDSNITSNLQIIANQQKFTTENEFDNSNAFPTFKLVGLHPAHGGSLDDDYHVIHATENGELKVNITGVEATEAFNVTDVNTHSNLIIIQDTQLDVLSNVVAVKNAVEGTLTVNSTIQNASLTVDGDVNSTLKAKYTTSGDTELSCTQTGSLNVNTGLDQTSQLYGWNVSGNQWDKVEIDATGLETALYTQPSSASRFKIQGYDNGSVSYKDIAVDGNGKMEVVVNNQITNYATQTTLSSIDTKITNCDTSAISGSVSITNTPSVNVSNQLTGYATENTLSSMNNKITTCDTSAISGSVSITNTPSVNVSNQLTGYATENTLSSINTKITNCNTSSISGSVSITGTPSVDVNNQITGYATSANQTTTNGHLSTISTNIQKTLRQYRAEGKCFSCDLYALYNTGNYYNIGALFNPVGSGKILYVYQIILSTNNNANFKLQRISGTAPSGGSSGTAVNLLFSSSAQSSVASLRENNITVSNPIDFQYQRVNTSGTGIMLDYQEDFIEIHEGYGINCTAQSVASVPLDMSIRWFEE